jgi:hypothetical protein
LLVSGGQQDKGQVMEWIDRQSLKALIEQNTEPLIIEEVPAD